jgi:hypothetical protein
LDDIREFEFFWQYYGQYPDKMTAMWNALNTYCNVPAGGVSAIFLLELTSKTKSEIDLNATPPDHRQQYYRWF